MLAELVQTVVVDVVDAAFTPTLLASAPLPAALAPWEWEAGTGGHSVDASGTCSATKSRDIGSLTYTLAAHLVTRRPLLQAFELSLARVLGLALHVIIVVGRHRAPDEERGGKERGGCRADLLDSGDRVRKRRCVVEHLLVEATRTSALTSKDEGQPRDDGPRPGQLSNKAAHRAGEDLHRLPGRHVALLSRCAE